jgi:hypothetical protein
MIKRPSEHECKLKLRKAKECIEEGNAAFADPSKVVGEIFDDLELFKADEVFPLILELLPEISPKDYKGERPPAKSYELKIKDCDLFPFVWDSRRLGKKL